MTSTIQLPSGTVAFDERGEGPPLVLFASGSHSRSDFDELRSALGDGVRTIAMDWPGHGDSPAPTVPGSVTSWADVAAEFVAAVAPEGAVVAGNSIGGFSAGRLAVRRPELVRGLVLIDSGGMLAADGVARVFCGLMGRPRFLRGVYPTFSWGYMKARTDADRLARRHAIANLTRPETAAFVAGLWASFPGPEHTLMDGLGSITVPTLLLWGTKDPVIPVKVPREMVRRFPDASLVEVESGHVPHTSDPARCAEAIQAVIDRAWSGQASRSGPARTG